jgi:hypothetical protein
MKLDITSLFFNSILEDGVGTPSWGTALGQKEGYQITKEGSDALLLAFEQNILDPQYLEDNLRGKKDILKVAIFNNVTINNEHKIKKPFVMAIIEEHSYSHNGRKTLKYNDKFIWDDGNKKYSNVEFYSEVQKNLGSNSCWFAHEINYLTGQLDIKVKVVSPKSKKYYNSKERKNHWNKLVENKIEKTNALKMINFLFKIALNRCNLVFEPVLVDRFVASILTKPFLILTGLSGSGKTKLAQAFVQWICASHSQYKIIPVGADWTNREPLLGYPNGLSQEKYESPESGALKLLMDAVKNPDKPYFMILDEMNLSHVERYFADFLSVMESNDNIKLYDGAKRNDGHGEHVPNEITWPQNLFIIGTVNIDETTYMFSPKVLDRANVIEFRINESDMFKFIGKYQKPNMKKLFVDSVYEKGGAGQKDAITLLDKAKNNTIVRTEPKKQELINTTLHFFFKELQAVGAEFGYRTASEIELLISNLEEYIADVDTRLDIAIMQKLLPKLHGSRKKLIDPLETLAGLCIDNEKLDVKQTGRELYKHWNELKDGDKDKHIRFKISFEKIMRMHHNSIQNGYTSYAEA